MTKEQIKKLKALEEERKELDRFVNVHNKFHIQFRFFYTPRFKLFNGCYDTFCENDLELTHEQASGVVECMKKRIAEIDEEIKNI